MDTPLPSLRRFARLGETPPRVLTGNKHMDPIEKLPIGIAVLSRMKWIPQLFPSVILLGAMRTKKPLPKTMWTRRMGKLRLGADEFPSKHSQSPEVPASAEPSSFELSAFQFPSPASFPPQPPLPRPPVPSNGCFRSLPPKANFSQLVVTAMVPQRDRARILLH